MKTRTLAAVACLAALPGIAAAEEYSATVVAGHPPVFRWVQMIDQAFAPGVNAALEGTGQSMRFTGQYGGAIAGVGDELETVEAGLAEIGVCQSLFDPAKLAVLNVTYYTPFVSDDPRTVSILMDRLQRDDPRMAAPWAANGVVYLGAPIGIDDYLLMTDFPVASLADLEGRKIAAPGPAINWLSGTGAVGVSGNLTTYYNELQTGVYDGVIVFASAARMAAAASGAPGENEKVRKPAQAKLYPAPSISSSSQGGVVVGVHFSPCAVCAPFGKSDPSVKNASAAAAGTERSSHAGQSGGGFYCG